MGKSTNHWKRFSRLSLLTNMLLSSTAAFANPMGGEVVAGSADIASSGNDLNITQHSNRVAIDWRTFDIAPGEHTRFIQPSANAVALNRIRDTNPSHIAGKLSANGKLVLINPNGIVFDGGAMVDVNGLVATTADISNDDFMAGKTNFNIPGKPDASIVNEGTITARDAGLVGLVAPNVVNRGVIEARLGRVQLASGDMATVDLYGDGLMEVKLSDAVSEQLVKNTGTIRAEGGTIALTAAAGRQLVNSLIEVDGELDAQAISQQGGRIIIAAEGSNAVAGNVVSTKNQRTGNSTVLVSATLDVSADNPGGQGGQVEITGDQVAILSRGRIRADGANGGGTVLVGGDYLGGGDTAAARTTIVQDGSLITANATEQGDGGKVIVWADEGTQFGGNIEVKGGMFGGDGGFVETSGKAYLDAWGLVNASALSGKAGTYLLDPFSVTIQATGPASNVTGDPNFTLTGQSGIITTASILDNLNNGTNVTITTGAGGTQAGDITWAADSAIEKTQGGDATLTLSSYRGINLNSDIISSHNKLHLMLNTNNTGVTGGHVLVAGKLDSNGGNITIGGGPDPISAGSGYAKGTTAQNAGVNITADILARGGNILINGLGRDGTANNSHGVLITGATIATTGNGTLDIFGRGTGGGNSSASYGIAIRNGSQVRAEHATLRLDGIGGGSGTGQNNYGVYITSIHPDTSDPTRVATTGTGNISITGVAGNAAGSGNGMQGVRVDLGARVQAQGSGNITLHGTGSGASGNNSYGVIGASGAAVLANTGHILMTGIGGQSTGTGHNGIYFTNAEIATGGNGTITLRGTGGTNSDSSNNGISLASGATVHTEHGNIIVEQTQGGGAGNGFYITGDNSSVYTTGTGNIDITGSGSNHNSDSSQSYGVYIRSNKGVETRGTGQITLRGTGGSTQQGSNYGINIGANSSVDGNGNPILLIGQGGEGGDTNVGIYIANNGFVQTNGNGTITLDGVGGGAASGGGNHYGIYLSNGKAVTEHGLLKIERAQGGGRAGEAGNNNIGLYLYGTSGEQAYLRTTGTGNIDITATGGGGSGSSPGVRIRTDGFVQAQGSGNIIIRGDGGNTTSGSNNHGILVNGGISANGGAISLIGTGAAASGGNAQRGIVLSGATITNTGAGGISFLGTGGGLLDSSTNDGIYIGSSTVRTESGLLHLDGTGGGVGSGGDNYGIVMLDASTVVESTDGAIELIGTGGNRVGTGNSNYGIYVYGGSEVRALGTGTISLDGTGGGYETGGTNVGTFISSNVTGNGGLITILGQGGPVAANSNVGIRIDGGTVRNYGLGAVVLEGQGGAGGDGSNFNHGLLVINGGQVLTDSGSITVQNTQGGGSGSGRTNHGVYITGSASRLRALDTGAVNITARGGSLTGTGGYSNGIRIESVDGALSTGGGNITLHGTGGGSNGPSTEGQNQGVYISGSVRTTGGNIDITGIGGEARGGNNQGIYIGGTDSALTTNNNGTITLHGTGRGAIAGSNANHGIFVDTGATIRNGRGDVTFTGTGFAAGDQENHGILFSSGATLTATSNAHFNLFGTGGTSASSYGISLQGANIIDAANGGDVTLRSNRFASAANNSLTTNGGRWLLYSQNPATDTLGGLSTDFRRFSCSYGGSCPSFPASGNGLLYSASPTLTATPVAITMTYGDTPSLLSYGFVLSGYLDGDAALDTVGGDLNGSTNYTLGGDVGHYRIDHSTGMLSSALGYQFSYADNTAGLQVTPRILTAALTGTASKVYDGTTSATLGLSHYTLGNIFGSDDVTLGNYASGNYATKQAGTGKQISVSGLTLTGTKAANYTLASSSVSGPIGTILQKLLRVSAEASIAVGETPNYQFSYLTGDLLAGDTLGSIGLSGQPRVSSPSNATYLSPGRYTLTLDTSGVQSTNYRIVPAAQAGAVHVTNHGIMATSVENRIAAPVAQGGQHSPVNPTTPGPSPITVTKPDDMGPEEEDALPDYYAL